MRARFFFFFLCQQLTANVNLNKAPGSHQGGFTGEDTYRVRLATWVLSLEPCKARRRDPIPQHRHTLQTLPLYNGTFTRTNSSTLHQNCLNTIRPPGIQSSKQHGACVSECDSGCFPCLRIKEILIKVCVPTGEASSEKIFVGRSICHLERELEKINSSVFTAVGADRRLHYSQNSD